MQFFIDTANIEEIKEAHSWGVLDGVTTNPSLCAKEGKPFDEVAAQILELVKGPVSLEVVAEDAATMIAEGKKLAQLGDQVVVKLPMGQAGIQATHALSKEGIAVNVTLCFSALQGLLAAKAGAAYVSPFLGRLDDIAHTGMGLIEELVTIYDQYDFDTQVLVASVRHPLHVLDAALLGADVATIPFSVLKKFAHHPLTDLGIEKFNADWQKVPSA